MHLCIMTADYVVKPVLSGGRPAKKEEHLLLNAGQK